MKYAKLELAAREMTAEEQTASLRSLLNDPRMAAVVKLIQDQKDVASDAASQLKFAEQHGCLAHAGGVRYAMLELEGKLKQLADASKRRGQQAPPLENT